MTDLQQEIEDFFADYSQRWNSQDYASLGECWDQDDTQPFYRPMERENFITDRESLRKYWNPVPGKRVIGGLWNVYTNLKPKLVGADVVVVTFDLEWDLKPPGPGLPVGGTDPGMAVLKKTAQGWRMVAYVEACMSPITYVRKMFEQQARPSFIDFLRQREAENEARDPAAK